MQFPVPICVNCTHFKHKPWSCPGFKGAIPVEILTGQNDHSKPLAEQDNDIVFNPRN